MNRVRYQDVKSKEQEFVALTSLTVAEFERLDGKPRTKRRYTTYQNCPLPTAEDRLLFVLSYMKSNALQSHHGLLFGMGQGKTNVWLHVLLPVLRESLRTLAVTPSRSMSELAEQLGSAEPAASDAAAPDAPPPLFAMTARNGASSVPKLRLNRALTIAARKKVTP